MLIYFVFAGKQLTDKHINFAQNLVGSKYKSVYGLHLTLTLHKAKRVPAKCAKKLFTDNALQDQSLDSGFHNS